MVYNIRFLPKANRDLIEVCEYLSIFYPSTLKNFISNLDKKMQLLKTMPYIGEKYREYRKLIVDNYIILYFVNLETNTIDIYRILHGKRDIRNNL